MLPRIARLAGLGAFAACGGLSLLFGITVRITRPGGASGLDLTTSLVTWISLGGVTAALIVVHMVIGRQLLLLGRGVDQKHPL